MSKTKICDSVQAIQKYGVPLSTARYMVYNHFYFPERYLDILSTYFTRRWETSHFFNIRCDGMIEYDGEYYQVIYHKTDPTKLYRRKDFTTVKLSFRVASSLFGIPPTVLVMEVRD